MSGILPHPEIQKIYEKYWEKAVDLGFKKEDLAIDREGSIWWKDLPNRQVTKEIVRQRAELGGGLLALAIQMNREINKKKRRLLRLPSS